METTADAKETLRKFFADHAETELTKGDVEQWLKTLGVALKKKDVYNAAAALAEYLIDVKGYGTHVGALSRCACWRLTLHIWITVRPSPRSHHALSLSLVRLCRRVMNGDIH